MSLPARIVRGSLFLSVALAMMSASGVAFHVVHNEPGLIEVADTSGLATGWVSYQYLSSHHDRLPNGVAIPAPGFGFGDLGTHGCNRNVCITLQGQHTIVTNWTTTAYGDDGCQEPFFTWTNPRTSRAGPYLCPEKPGVGVYFDTTGPTGSFAVGNQLCNTWHTTVGRPCETIQ